MSLRPEQERALAYIQHKGTEGRLEEIRLRVTHTFQELLGQLDDLDSETARRRPPSGGWCVQEVVDHLVVSNRPAAEQLRSLLRGQRPPGGPVPASLQSANPLGQAWDDARADLGGVQSDIAYQLATANDSFTTTARAPVMMVVKVKNDAGVLEPLEWEQDFDWKAFALLLRVHTQEHILQVRRILKELEGASPC